MVISNKTLQIRNSTAEFLIFSSANGENSIEVRYEDKNIWLSQKMMSVLFGVSIPTVNEHLKNLLESGELKEEGTIRNFLIVQKEGLREVSRNINYYNLEGIISVGFKVNSSRAVEFRNWAKSILKSLSFKRDFFSSRNRVFFVLILLLYWLLYNGYTILIIYINIHEYTRTK